MVVYLKLDAFSKKELQSPVIPINIYVSSVITDEVYVARKYAGKLLITQDSVSLCYTDVLVR